MSMQIRALDDNVFFWFAANDTAGSGDDGASAVFDVRLGGAAADAAPVYSGSATLLSHANYPAGCYEIEIPATEENGFAEGETYGVFCTLAVDGQNPSGHIGAFQISAPLSAESLAEALGSLTDLTSFPDGSLAKTIGTNLDAAVSSRADASVWDETKADEVSSILEDTTHIDSVIGDLVSDISSLLTSALGSVIGTPSDLGSGATIAANLVDIEGFVDNLPGDPADQSAVESAIDAAASAIVGKMLKYVQLLARKDSAIAADNATELGEINNDEGSGSGAYSNTADSQEAIRDRGDAAWTGGGEGGGSADWTADERTAIRAILGIPDSGTTPDDPSAGILDTIRDAIGTPSDLGGGASLADNLQDIDGRVVEVGNELNGIPSDVWNRGPLTEGDPGTFGGILRALQPVAGTVGDTGNDSTHLHLPALGNGDDEINGLTLLIFDDSTGTYHVRTITDWVESTKLATVDTLPFTPEDDTDIYWLLPSKQSSGGAGLDAAGVRAAIGLATANLDAQLADLPTNSELASALASADDAVLSAIGSLNDLSAAEVNAQVDAAIETYHLDHLLAVEYDPSSKPGSAAALLNVLVENDDGEPRFTANALETAPVGEGGSGGGGLDAAGIRNAIGLASANLDTQLSGISSGVTTVLADTNELQTDWADGGRLDVILDARASQSSVDDLPTSSELTIALSGIAAVVEAADIREALGMSSANLDTQLAPLANLPSGIKRNTAFANFPFDMVLASDHVSAATGLTITAVRSIDGGAFTACTNSPVEVGNGTYTIDLAAADLNGASITFKFSGSGADVTTVVVKTNP